jgi:hypothetical protein
VLFCVMRVICVLCLIVVPLPPGKNPFAVKINNNNNNNNNNSNNNTSTWYRVILCLGSYDQPFCMVLRHRDISYSCLIMKCTDCLSPNDEMTEI